MNKLEVMSEKFLEWLGMHNYSQRTVKTWREALGFFFRWCDDRYILKPEEVTRQILERYQRYLFHYRKKDGQPLSFKTQTQRLAAIKAYFKYLARSHYLVYNPASELELPKQEYRLPKAILTQAEAELAINQTDINETYGLRDRAILETFYSTGMRRMELINLKVYDVDFDRGTVMIRKGKGNKDRMIPIGQRAIKWIEKYLYELRPSLVVEPDESYLFLSKIGKPFTGESLGLIVRKYIKSADIGKSGSCHLFRHTMATLMLENGADIRFIQQMLGHAKLDTTQIYTQVSIKKLKEIHELTHPAKMERATKNTEIEV
jgi:integrase/recombinase XerD